VVFIRRVRTASGATAVPLAQYANGRQEIVAHVGSAHSQAELGVLMAQARALLEDPGQCELDLGVEPTPLVSSVLGPLTLSRGRPLSENLPFQDHRTSHRGSPEARVSSFVRPATLVGSRTRPRAQLGASWPARSRPTAPARLECHRADALGPVKRP